MTPTRHLQEVRDLRIEATVPLAPPVQVLEELPLNDDQAEVVLNGRAEITGILERADDRLLVVVGPCSVHDVEAAREYAQRLSARASELRDDLCVAMRVYFEKPRTNIGWKGMITDPHLDGSGDVNAGVRMARGLLLDVLALGLPVGVEWLDPITPQYISDTVAWGAIGARTVESQTHRQLGSGLSMPVGFKNRTDGNVQVAVDAVRAAAVKHSFAGVELSGKPAILHTRGNHDCHIILRGGRKPNYSAHDVGEALAMLRAANLPERIVIDASHGNSSKDHRNQPGAASEIGAQVAAGNEAIVGVMLESFLVAGRQNHDDGAPLTYGQSITDACIDWDTTSDVLEELATAVQARRRG
jgi:3-deoxy-7-phosphoheptulonate synthase